jgi:hypothetical protein
MRLKKRARWTMDAAKLFVFPYGAAEKSPVAQRRRPDINQNDQKLPDITLSPVLRMHGQLACATP